MKFSTTLSAFVLAFASFAQAQLGDKIAAKGKANFGAAADANTLQNANVQRLLQEEFSSVTPENSMKWEVIQPSLGTFNFQQSDALVDFAVENGLDIRGHTLVWHSQLPAYVDAIIDKDQLLALMENHINTTMSRYQGKIFQWDVVNEVFEEDGSFRNSVFFRLLGEEFIDTAFNIAASVDPSSKLYINDFNLDGPGPKIDAMIGLLGRLQTRGVPIDGVGSQAHLILGQVGSVGAQLARLAETGLEVAITELDIRIEAPVDQAKLIQQQQDYQTVVGDCIGIAACVGVTVWGVGDKDSWVDATFAGFDSPLLFDDGFVKKPAYAGVEAALGASVVVNPGSGQGNGGDGGNGC
ncbi:glycosyl hydrolase family 10 protein [Ascobolus immersus RN42]|uniref:Beta-xylanase n=1 Tax=Ascobolus immersus RN42 TaxID=1160509 RepID=A0A3N4IB66_ASCIM|nr:glycosyl hydrolase family 10 protein [Ascobolus immersus RN42]